MNRTPIRWRLLKKSAMCVLVHSDKIRCSDPAKLQKSVWKRPIITSCNSFMAQEIYGDRNSVRCKGEWTNKNIWRKHRACKANLSTFVYEVHPYCCQAIGSTMCNSAKSPTEKFKIVCLQSASVIGTSAKRHAKTKIICSGHASTNFCGWSIPRASFFQWWGNFSCLRKVKQTQFKNLGIRKPPCD